MTGKRGGAEGLLEKAEARLEVLIDREVERVDQSEDPADWALAEKRGRTLSVLARAVRNIRDLSKTRTKSSDPEGEETDMNDDDDLTAEQLVHARLELVAKVIERARLRREHKSFAPVADGRPDAACSADFGGGGAARPAPA